MRKFEQAPPLSRDELHRLFAIEGLSMKKIAVLLQSSEGTVGRTIRLLREREGVERWPLRTPALQPPAEAPVRAAPLRPGQPTLPPLASLNEQ